MSENNEPCPAEIDVCICTYRRPSVANTILAIAKQEGIEGKIRLVVADNDETPSARNVVEASAREANLELCYIHAPARNISIARNACLDAVTAPMLAFVDDDLVPSQHWLSALISAQARTGADIVLGPVLADYPDAAPKWARDANLHSTLPTILPDQSIITGYTCNVLMLRKVIDTLRFDPKLGRSGGEDTIFFHKLWQSGARIAYAPEAIIRELVDPARINLPWLLKRSFRAGQTHARVFRSRGERPLILVPKLLCKAGYCFMVSVVNLYSPVKWRRSLVRGALHVGVLSQIMGAQDIELY